MKATIYCVVVALLLLVIPAASGQALTLEKRQILDGKVEILIPGCFTEMDPEMLQLKYPSAQRPREVFTDERGATNVAFNWTQNKADQAALPAYEKALYSALQKAQPNATWYGHGLRTIHGRQVGYLEMLTPAIDTEIYNLMFFTDVEGRLLIVTFNCVKKDLEVYKASAQRIMASLQVVKK
ncbi:hypothetical protein KBK19_10705 [Microvirga sp. STR05]|uniref:DUF1795 domain-containing protein n=1 Tax=Hymenobacter duratus TaxID=2771356 RepID=A0ABR8JF55_9BACT|nr:hypothetical protein [Hymenobacter duratus]MBD2715506.1 hypothetical protein [Hymenobacter duratus]MBR7950414.1 hypothetical protein [Microvirga sp. STR05]